MECWRFAEMTWPLIFLSGPISNGNTASDFKTLDNVFKAEKIMLALVAKGWSVYCPHIHYRTLKVHDAEDMFGWRTWMNFDRPFLERADACFYMIPEKYGPSKGAEEEVAMAASLDIPIYRSLDEVPDREAST